MCSGVLGGWWNAKKHGVGYLLMDLRGVLLEFASRRRFILGSLGSCEGLDEREVEKWEKVDREVFERDIKRRNDALKVDYRRGMVENRSAFGPGAN